MARNFETFRTEQELIDRIEELRAAGYADSEIEVLSNNKIEDVNYANYGKIEEPETFGDKVRTFFTGEEPVYHLDRYGFDDATREEALTALENGYYLLEVNRDDYYDNPELYESRLGYVDEDIRTRDDLTAEQKIVLHEERLRVNKEKVQTGEVRIDKEVVTETQEFDVPLEKERVTVERRELNDDAKGYEFGSDSETISVPITEERVSVEKDTVATEELSINRDVYTETEKVSGEVRKERAHIVDDSEGLTEEERLNLDK